jgi:hypothetical protein
LGALAALGSPAAAQVADGRRIYEENLRTRLDEQIPAEREADVDVGGWFNFALFNYDDGVDSRHRTLRQYQLRAWARANIFRAHEFYIRGLVGWDDWNPGDHPLGKEDEDLGPEIERAWYRLDVAQIVRNHTGTIPPWSLEVKVGREFTQIGTALTLSMPLDLVQIDAAVGDWELMALLAKTRGSSDNSIDSSDQVWDHQQRCFYGGQVTYRGLDQHRPFAYVLFQRDSTDERTDDPLQSYQYNSQYVGIGSTGSLMRNLRYQVEIVGEQGTTYSELATGNKDRICAMAADVLVEYLFDVKTRPRVSFEFLYGSGDADRRISANSTVGGNLAGTKDHAFNAFGFRDTGLAFAPRIANLHLWTLGAACHPLEHVKLCKELEVGTKAFFYHKATSGPLSDTTATNPQQWAGWEWDLYANWRLTSDLTWTIRYGAFMPGESFNDRTCRQFLLTAVTFSF